MSVMRLKPAAEQTGAVHLLSAIGIKLRLTFDIILVMHCLLGHISHIARNVIKSVKFEEIFFIVNQGRREGLIADSSSK